MRNAAKTRLGSNLKVDGRGFAFFHGNLELDLLAFHQRAQTRFLNSGDVDEYVLGTIVRLDKAKAFRWVEPFHFPHSHVDLPLCCAG